MITLSYQLPRSGDGLGAFPDEGMRHETSYDKPTDSLFVEVRALPSCRAIEIEEYVMVDYGLDDESVGYDIQHVPTKTDFIMRIIFEKMLHAAE